MTTPATPTRRSRANGSEQDDFNSVLATISQKWDLQLAVPQPNDSPSSRKSRSNTEVKEIAATCVARLKYLYFKNAYEIPLQRFTTAAWSETSSWMYKPNADPDTIPNGVVGPLSQVQRITLLHLLRNELDPEVTRIQREQTARALERSKRSEVEPISYPPLHEQRTPRPLSKDLPKPLPHSKRNSSGIVESDSISKKSKIKEEHNLFVRIDDIPVATRKTPEPKSSSKRHIESRSSNNLFSKFAATKPQVQRESTSISSADSNSSISFSSTSSGVVKCRGGFLESANTSYSSDMGKVSGGSKTAQISADVNYTADLFQSQSFSQLDAQFDDDFGPEDFPSTASLMINTPTSAEERIKLRLQGVFPGLPKCLEKAQFAMRYEIARVFLHTRVPLSHLDALQMPDFSSFHNYETLWQWLKSIPALIGKTFPPKSDAIAWEMSLDTFSRSFKRVFLSGALRLPESDDEPLFIFQLHPLHIELSHRLGRRFGNDRFIEVTMPILEEVRKLPKKLAQLMQLIGKQRGRDLINEWLHRAVHEFLGRTWGSFHVKDRSRKKKQQGANDDEDADLVSMKRICFFATSGIDFHKTKKLPPKDEPIDNHSEMTVEAMLDWLLSLQTNGGQSFLKFYSRISLGLSTTYGTVVLLPIQIKRKQKDLRSKKDIVMNDGCGRMSMKLAMNISTWLGLTFVPSAFQGRLGEAKGLWIVDYQNAITKNSDEIAIETYPSQRKWDRNISPFFPIDEEHRRFEVVKWCSPLKSAALTLQFLPLLEDRGVPRDAISRILINGLTHELGQMVAAIQNPQSFRKWLREHHPSVSERLKTGSVRFLGGRPDSMEETLNMLLDAGFDAKTFGYARELARKAFHNNCEILKEKLNIRVGLSTYAYIAVDFQGVLEPDEIHLCFSNTFCDEISGKTLLELDNMDVLIARSPAHLVSDMQKVRAVFKPELMGYKDVVILPRTGDSPLAGLLSGGDYDGDTVWLCFDQSIVKNFKNAVLPDEPNLLENLSGDGAFLRKNRTTFSEVMANGPDSFTQFLQKSFDFNFRMSYLGICTNYKEKLCYDQNTVSSRNAEFLSVLLSKLVDQNKQGFEFEDDDWARVRSYISKTKSRMTRGRTDHIKDFLKRIAEETTANALKEYHESLPLPEYFDQDLVKCANEFRALAKKSDAHKEIWNQLKRDLEAVKTSWKKSRSHDETKIEKSAFRRSIAAIFDSWQDIQPIGDEFLKPTLLQESWCHPDHSQWALLKASALFASYETHRTGSKGWEMPSLPWYMACRQLCQLKAMAGGHFNAVAEGMFAMLKPDNHFVKMMQSERLDPKFREAKGDVEEEEDEDEEGEEGGERGEGERYW